MPIFWKALTDSLIVVDLSDPEALSIVGGLLIGTAPSSIYVSGRYAFVVDQESDDLKVIDISNPHSPVITGSLAIGGGPVSVFVSGRYAVSERSQTGV